MLQHEAGESSRHLVPSAATLVLLSLLGLVATTPVRASNGPMPTVVGTKGPVTMPVDGDAQTMFRMPSSIGWSLDHRIDLDAFVYRVYGSIQNSRNDFSEESYNVGGTGGVIFAPGRPDWEKDDDKTLDAYTPAGKVTIGFGVFIDMAGGSGPKDKIRLATFPEGIAVRTAIQFLTPALNVAFTPTKWLSIGLGLHAIYCTLNTTSLVGGSSTPLGGSPRINGVPLPGNPTYGDFLALFASDNATDPTTIFKGDFDTFQFSANLSVSLRPNDLFGLGFSYRDRSWSPMPFKGDGEIDATRTFDQALAGLAPNLRQLFLSTLPQQGNAGFRSKYDAELRGLHVPRQVRMSAAVWPTSRLVFGAELAWIEWHRAFGEAKIKLKNGSNQDLNFVIGSNSVDSGLVQRWQNRFVVSLYGAFAVTDTFTVRGGFSYGESPFNPNRQGVSATAGFVSTDIIAGCAWKPHERVDLALLLEFSPAAHAKADQSPQQLTAKGSSYSSEQLFIHFGFGFRF
jgi:long-subunit fatty acid transport protein